MRGMDAGSDQTLQPNIMRFTAFLISTILLLLISPAIIMKVTGYGAGDLYSVLRALAVPLLVFLAPIAIFYRNVKLYLWLLLPLVIVTPLFLFSTYYFAISPGFELIAFILQTNVREASEAITPFLIYLIPFQLTFTGLYVFALRKLPLKIIRLKTALVTSLSSVTVLGVMTIHVNGLYWKPFHDLSKDDLLLKYDYPIALVSGANEARVFLMKNNLREAESFSFRAVKNDTLHHRQVYVLIIGESSRFDRWQVNGFHRETSPLLNTVSGLTTFKDVVAGAHYTWVSVPQIITRANPDNYSLQYREKSILGVFSEAGFYTYWLSNQSDQDIFWSGSITLHAKTADVSVFSPTYSPNMEFEDIYDGRLLPILDSVLVADKRNLFIVLHTMGNHWEYSRRYPAEFDFFQPSGRMLSINPPDQFNREALLNSYDNSIRYADYFIYNVIRKVEANADIATVVFISDHGEDLYDTFHERPDFHFRPSAATLRVPLFIWTSESYNSVFPGKRLNLEANVSKKIGTENIFYTLSDIANITMEGFDSTRSFAHPAFVPSEQKFYGDDKHARLFRDLP